MRHCRPCLCRWRGGFIFTPPRDRVLQWEYLVAERLWFIRKICFSRAGSRSGLFPANLCSSPLRRRRSRRSTGITSSAGSAAGSRTPHGAGGLGESGGATCPGRGAFPAPDGGLGVTAGYHWFGSWAGYAYRAARPDLHEGPKRVRTCCSAGPVPPSGRAHPHRLPLTATTPTTRRTPPLVCLGRSRCSRRCRI